jgi:RNA polymerase sigma-70 factor (sigma-E family)
VRARRAHREPNPRPTRLSSGDEMLSAHAKSTAATPTSRIGDLYLGHADAAVRLAYLLTGDRDLAEDLVQDAFVRLAGRLVHLRDPGAFEAYLRKTVVNLSNSYFRRRRIERNYEVRARGGLSDAAPGHPIEERAALAAALRTLPQRQRAAIVLRFYEDLSEAQTADVIGCRPGTVKSLVSRGLEALRKEIGSEVR